MNHLQRLWRKASSTWLRLTGSLWFVPGAIALFAAALGLMMVEAAAWVDQDLLRRHPRLFGAGPDGARSMLATIAGSIITVAGVTFSIMLLAASQASTQFTPRVLRNFMRDRQTQAALGVFVGVFLYCLVVIRTIRSGEPEFIPSVAVFGAFVLAAAAVGVLMYFIHHIASTLEPGKVLQGVQHETCAAIERLFPEPDADTSSEDAELTAADLKWSVAPATRVGYVQYVNLEGLLALALERDCIVRMECAVGRFVFEGAPLVAITPGAADDVFTGQANELFVVDSYRTVHQDVEFGLRQMVDIALKSLSPSVNDPSTAIACLDYLTAALVKLSGRAAPARARYVDGRLRLITCGPSFEGVIALAFDEITRTGAGNRRVLLAIVRALEQIGAGTCSCRRRRVLATQVQEVEQAAREGVHLARDLEQVVQACARVRAALTASGISA